MVPSYKSPYFRSCEHSSSPVTTLFTKITTANLFDFHAKSKPPTPLQLNNYLPLIHFIRQGKLLWLGMITPHITTYHWIWQHIDIEFMPPSNTLSQNHSWKWKPTKSTKESCSGRILGVKPIFLAIKVTDLGNLWILLISTPHQDTESWD